MITLIADAGKSTCKKTDLIFRAQNDSITLMNSSSYYCNWLGVGNVMSYTELKLKKIDWDNLKFYGDYKVTAIGTAIGSGEGLGSFQVRRGKSVLTSAQQKHNDLQFFYANQKSKLNKLSSSEPPEIIRAQEDSEQVANIVIIDPLPSQSDITKTSGETENPVALKELDVKNSEASIANSKGVVAGEKEIAIEKARDEPLTAETAREEPLTADKSGPAIADSIKAAIAKCDSGDKAGYMAMIQRLADAGQGAAFYSLAANHTSTDFCGEKAVPDYAKAFDLYKKGARLGHINSGLSVTKLLTPSSSGSPTKVRSDRVTAIKWGLVTETLNERERKSSDWQVSSNAGMFSAMIGGALSVARRGATPDQLNQAKTLADKCLENLSQCD